MVAQSETCLGGSTAQPKTGVIPDALYEYSKEYSHLPAYVSSFGNTIRDAAVSPRGNWLPSECPLP